MKSNYSFLVIGKTQESTESGEGFKRYVGLASSYVLAVNPAKAELDKLMGFESQADPEYVKDGENGKEVHITFIVRTDPEANNGIEITNRLMFTLRNSPAYNRDQTKVQVIDVYGNSTWAPVEDAKAGKALPSNYKIDQNNYRMAAVGEADLVQFLKAYLCIPRSLDYQNGSWILSKDAENGKFGIEEIKNYFKGDFKELKEALAYQPHNKVKLLYGVRTTDEGRQYQAVCSRGEFILRNSANATAIDKLEKDLASAKANGSYSNIDYKVQELAEYVVEPTSLDSPAESSDGGGEMPWD